MRLSFPHRPWLHSSISENGMKDLIEAWNEKQRVMERSASGHDMEKDFEIVASSEQAGCKSEQQIGDDHVKENMEPESCLVMHILSKEFLRRPKEALVRLKNNSVAFHFNGSVYAATSDLLLHVHKCLDLLFPTGVLTVKFFKANVDCGLRLLFETELSHSPPALNLTRLVELASEANEAPI